MDENTIPAAKTDNAEQVERRRGVLQNDNGLARKDEPGKKRCGDVGLWIVAAKE